MHKDLEAFVSKQNLFVKDDRILLALSGGADSVVLATLMLECGYHFSAAHCNFHLRGKESMRDEAFVRAWAKEHDVELFVKDFDTFGYMQQKKISLEMAARELRYSWFEELIADKGLDYLATAHHADDSAETFFINLLRGTGIAGLHGILPKSGHIVRPLLFATRKRIVEFAKQRNIAFVEDSTNSQTKFLRNKIRHQLFPLLREIAPSFDETIAKNIERLRETEMVYSQAIKQLQNELLSEQNGVLFLQIADLLRQKPKRILLYEILSQYGFNESNCNDILSALNSESGRQFVSKTHRIVKDRTQLIITPIEEGNSPQQYLISENQESIQQPFVAQIQNLNAQEPFTISRERNIAMIDKDALHFPLVLRQWKQGDKFVPLGMKKPKKLSDFFTAEKYSLVEKQQQWLLCSRNEIVWVVGRRLDERFKVSDTTKNILKIQIDQ